MYIRLYYYYAMYVCMYLDAHTRTRTQYGVGKVQGLTPVDMTMCPNRTHALVVDAG